MGRFEEERSARKEQMDVHGDIWHSQLGDSEEQDRARSRTHETLDSLKDRYKDKRAFQKEFPNKTGSSSFVKFETQRRTLRIEEAMTASPKTHQKQTQLGSARKLSTVS